jgi:hypothetical protein
MPRDGSLILSDVREPTLAIVCEACGRVKIKPLILAGGDQLARSGAGERSGCAIFRGGGTVDGARDTTTRKGDGRATKLDAGLAVPRKAAHAVLEREESDPE